MDTRHDCKERVERDVSTGYMCVCRVNVILQTMASGTLRATGDPSDSLCRRHSQYMALQPPASIAVYVASSKGFQVPDFSREDRKDLSMGACEAVYASTCADIQQLTGLKKEGSKMVDNGSDTVTIKIAMESN